MRGIDGIDGAPGDVGPKGDAGIPGFGRPGLTGKDFFFLPTQNWRKRNQYLIAISIWVPQFENLICYSKNTF